MDPSFDFVEERAFSSWVDFRNHPHDMIRSLQATYLPEEAAEKHKSNRRRQYVFRGQARASWPLWASFQRTFADHKKLEDARKYYESYFRRFLMNSLETGVFEDRDWYGLKAKEVLDPKEESLESFLKYESLARHWGLPTRLLDWTWSFYVATFFAFWRSEDLTEPNVAIWALDTEEIEKCFDDSISIVEEIYPGNQIRTAQAGLYVINQTNVLRLEDVIKRGSGRCRTTPKFPVLFKLLLPKTEAEEILLDLHHMRISPIYMFPGRDGIVLHYREFLKQMLTDAERAMP